MKKKFHVKKGDNVMVITGDSKGQQGRILKINADNGTAIVEGINIVHKHTKPNNDNPKGGIIQMEASIRISNLKIVDSKGLPTRIEKRLDEKTNKMIRYSKKSGEVIK